MVPGPADSVTGSPFRTISNSNSPTRTRKVSAAGRVCIFAGPPLAGISASKGAKTNRCYFTVTRSAVKAVVLTGT